MLEISNLHVDRRRQADPAGHRSHREGRRSARDHGPERFGQEHACPCAGGREAATSSPAARSRYLRPDLLDAARPRSARTDGLFLAFQYPVEIPGVTNVYLLKAALNAHPQAPRRAGTRRDGIPALVKDKTEAHGDGPETCCTAQSTKVFPAAKRSATRSCRWRCWSPGSPSLTRPIPASTSMRSRSSPRASTRMRSPERAIVLVTHYQRLLDYVVPDQVHVLAQGRIVKSGGAELALELETRLWLDRHAGGHPSGGRPVSATALEHYLAEFTRVEAILPGRRLPWLTRARKEALAHFAQAGFPTLRQEDWKYTSVAALERSRFAVAPQHPDDGLTVAVGVQSETLALPDTDLLVFVNGRHQPQWSRLCALPSGVTLTSLAAALEREPERLEDLICRRAHNYPSGFAALHAAFMADGAYIRLGAGAALEKPIHLLFLATEPGLVTHQCNVVIADAGSRVAIVEHHVGTYV